MNPQEQPTKTSPENAKGELSEEDLEKVAGGGPGDPIKGVGVGVIRKPAKVIAPTPPTGSAKNYNEGRSNTAAN